MTRDVVLDVVLGVALDVALDLDQAGLTRLGHSRFDFEPVDHLGNHPGMAHTRCDF
ncbi:hypothetical protein [Bradyrhizobium japonicum]|uniref:hypothetical protein n=1 Tax=Bradyrhizobium japonicum TaxID=375 RepID=UPI001BA92D4F|nr:hypothetical protein [Bradyrhizobium japonicum]MBR0961929.1 hypothetical protein [Bradyrhizobium japonicum]